MNTHRSLPFVGQQVLVSTLVMLLSSAGSAMAANVSFSSPTNYPVGTGPIAQAVGDFNGDGKPDLAVSNSASNDVSILLGKGDGTFQAAVSYAAGTLPTSLAAGDFNQDGKADLAVAGTSSSVSVLLGNGDGTFQVASNIGLDASPRSIAVADFNGDGRPDLAVGQAVFPAPGHVSILLGNGDGSFQAPTNYDVYYAPVSLAVADLNGDGKPDLVAAALWAQVGVLLGNGDGTFQAVHYLLLPKGNANSSVGGGDFNADGKPDLLVANGKFCLTTPCNFHGVELFLGNGDGTFHGPAAVASTSAYNWTSTSGLADFNLDGKLDAAFVSFDGVTGTVSVMPGNGDGSFQPPVSFTVGLNPVSLAAADFNGDGLSDLAVANIQDNTVSILLNTASVPTYILSLIVNGNGMGVVIIHPGLALCAHSCTKSFASGTQVTLGENPNGGSSFGGWGGACFGTSSCTLVMNSDKSATATFNTTVPPDFSLTASALSPSTVKAGQSATGTVSVNSTGGFNGAVLFTCSVQPSPSYATCALPFGSGGTVTVTTTAPSFARVSSSSSAWLYALWLPLIGFVTTSSTLRPRRNGKRKVMILLLYGVLISGLAFQMACGGGGSTQAKQLSGGTPPGDYTITVTGTSGSLQHSATFALTVQ